MAEAVFTHEISLLPPALRARIATIDSAGTGAYHITDPPDSRTIATLARHGITDYVHGARKVRGEDFTRFEYIVGMDGSNMRDLERAANKRGGKGGEGKGEVVMFGAFGGEDKREEVVDPYYGADDGFERVYQQCVRFSRGFIRGVLEREGGDEE